MTMQPVQDALVYVVDDDESVRQALAWLLRSRGLQTQCFDSAEGLIEHLGLDHVPQLPRQACCLLLDVRMPGISGLALFDRLIDKGCLPALLVPSLCIPQPHAPEASGQHVGYTYQPLLRE